MALLSLLRLLAVSEGRPEEEYGNESSADFTVDEATVVISSLSSSVVIVFLLRLFLLLGDTTSVRMRP